MTKPQRPRARTALQPQKLADPKVARAVDDLAGAVRHLETANSRSVVVQTLVAGRNIVPHSLGRAAQGATITPSVLTSAFAWALADADNPAPDRQAFIDMTGVEQPNATIEVF